MVGEYIERIKKTLKEDPFISWSELTGELGRTKQSIVYRIEKLAGEGDKNAKIWIETAPIRNQWKKFRYALQLLHYAFEQELTIEDVKRMELRSSGDSYSKENILSILKIKPPHKKQLKTLFNVKEASIELMKIGKKYDLKSEQIEYALKKYGILG